MANRRIDSRRYIRGCACRMITHFYAQRSSQELKREAKSLRHLTTLILRGLEEAGFVEFSRDEQGGLIGIAFKRPVSDVLGVGMVWR